MSLFGPNSYTKTEFLLKMEVVFQKYGKTKSRLSGNDFAEFLYEVRTDSNINKAGLNTEICLDDSLLCEVIPILIRGNIISPVQEPSFSLSNLKCFDTTPIHKTRINYKKILWSKDTYRNEIDENGNTISRLMKCKIYNALGEFIRTEEYKKQGDDD